jgi:predicted Zn-dependent protease with MMP-like domain
MKRMSLRRFAHIVSRVMETLPDEFQPYLDNIVVDVLDEPDEELLRRAGFTEEEIDAGDTLYGLFDPIDLPSDWGSTALEMHEAPHRIWIFKNPLEEDFPDRKQLLIEIRKTVIHELAHHFGFSEEDLEKFDAKDDPFGDGWEDTVS